jgi:pimeloyl-ACP methyl ester carboxylesterase
MLLVLVVVAVAWGGRMRTGSSVENSSYKFAGRGDLRDGRLQAAAKSYERKKAEVLAALDGARALGHARGKKRASRPGVLLVPGVGGTVLEQELAGAAPPHFFCSANALWSRAWLRLSYLVPELYDCFAWGMSRIFDPVTQLWRDQPGVTTRPGLDLGLEAINWIDPSDFATRHETVYFALTSAALLAAGWDNNTLQGLAYDWRFHGGEPEQQVTFKRMQATIEQLWIDGGAQPVVIVAHSMGNLITQRFLTSFVSVAWKDKYVAKWIAVCPPFGGAAIAVRSVLSGYNFGVPVLSNGEGLELAPFMGSTFYLLPQNVTFWGTLVQTVQGHSFTADDFGALFNMSGLKYAQERVDSAASSWSTVDPGVEVVIAAGAGLPTESSYTYDERFLFSGPTKVTVESGDGTVALRSALLPTTDLNWSNVSSQVFVKADHVAILQNAQFISWLLENL